ncbi:PilZ domain-containing protein [Novosphingobium aquiterrae]|uniref:PilZ domain-containing protein n=1 Tax=Novosphingobium aquiterrae TaxID=624388 RepID=A0ABV6PGG1_9SPHN
MAAAKVQKWNRKMVAAANKREERKPVMRPARVRWRAGEHDARLIDASSRGLSMTASRVPPRGEIVEVVLGRAVLVGQVRWNRADRFGVVLQDRLDVEALRSGTLVQRSAFGAAKSAEPAKQFAFHDKLFLAACGLAGVVFMIRALLNWV